MRLYCIILIAIFACSSPLRAAADITHSQTYSLRESKSNLIHAASMMSKLNCLSQNDGTVRRCEHLLLLFLQEIQNIALLENDNRKSLHELWAEGYLESYYDIESVKLNSDTYAIQVIPSDEGKIDFPSFCCNLYVEPDLVALLGGNPAVVYACYFLNEYQESPPSAFTVPHSLVTNIITEQEESKKQVYFNELLLNCITHLQKSIKDENTIINEGVLSYFIEISMIDEFYCIVRPKRPSCLNFQSFTLFVDMKLAFLLHSYGLRIS